MKNSLYISSVLAVTICVLSAPLLAADALPKTDFPSSVISAKAAKSGIKTAWYDDATTRYAHGVLGDAIEPSSLHAKTANGKVVSITLEAVQVFEDIQPRLADIDGDGQNEIITIRSHNQKGAQIAVYGITKAAPNTLSLITSTPYIGQAYRWLSPVGIADFNNDGAMDIAYIDRPHLAKILRVWSYNNGSLKQVGQKQGLTNHSIGHNYITGGVQRCGNKSFMITVDSNWQRLIKTNFESGKLNSQDIGPYTGKASAAAALNCQ
ncbi:FG-GAP repeat domain-containing protein [Leucothrix arctica]|uniref:VCBS repeat-containing protein n=1 Tax=Leucothrix arctica TaxID=1481894 RepID=A0A317C4L8_9GAMM|nr:VCBS repeat-containing protein [Leucothrix arctica]PWQ93554.1 hypothetical protein DKT75_18215 [Leucothrix arctica]